MINGFFLKLLTFIPDIAQYFIYEEIFIVCVNYNQFLISYEK